jgi:hypothetical protein
MGKSASYTLTQSQPLPPPPEAVSTISLGLPCLSGVWGKSRLRL